MSDERESTEETGTCPRCFSSRMPQRPDGIWACPDCNYEGDDSYEEILLRDGVS